MAADGRRIGTAAASPADPEAQLRTFIGKFAADDQRRIRAVRTALRMRLPTANELVYDNYNFFVIGYSPTLRPSDAILSIAARAGAVSLCFINGAKLPDPKKLLRGKGKQVRSLGVQSATDLSKPGVAALIAAAVERAAAPMPETGRGQLIIRSVAAKQRPRRKAAKSRDGIHRRRGGPRDVAAEPEG